MATASPIVGPPLSLEQLIALFEEIAAFSRAGVPLDQGLKELGRDLPGRLGKVAHELGEDLAAGTSLDQAVARAGGRFPPGYEALMRAGIRSGNLPGILQGMVQLARKTGEVRRQIAIAAINPLLTVVIAYCLFLFWLIKVAPVYLAMADDWEVDAGPVRYLVEFLRESIGLTWWLLPLVIAGGVVRSWRQSS